MVLYNTYQESSSFDGTPKHIIFLSMELIEIWLYKHILSMIT